MRVTTIRAVVSLTVPLNGGVLSLLELSSSTTTGAVISAETVPLPDNDAFPAGSVAIAVIISPLARPPGLATLQLPLSSASAVAIVPSGKVTVTVAPISAVPLIGSVTLTGSSSGASGAAVSTVTLTVSVTLLLPLTSVTTALY